MKYQFIEEQREAFPVWVMCKVLGVSSSGYYDWRQRDISQRERADQTLLGHIEHFHQRSRGTYGSPRIQADLRDMGIRCSRKRVARLMRQAGLQARGRRRHKYTTRAHSQHPVAPNILQQDFTAQRPNEKWLADMTYIRTHEGWLYLAVVLDVCSRKIVGWSMSMRQHKALVLDALRMALSRREIMDDLLHHSDRGSQYTSHDYRALLKLHGMTVSMSGTGNCYDNAMLESFFATLKTECITERFITRSQARQTIFEFIEIWYNRQRRHSALDYLSPADFEKLYH